jgi:hypothetical protein
LELAIDDEVLAAQDVECLVRPADIGRNFLHDAAQLLETTSPLSCRFRGLRSIGMRPL